MSILPKYAWLEIKNQKRFVILFVFNIVLGLLGPILVENFKGTFSELIYSKSQVLLGGDFSIRSRFEVENEILEGVKKDLKGEFLKTTQMFSMVKGKKVPRLVQLKVLDSKFPFYGTIQLESGRSWPSAEVDVEFIKGQKVFLYPELKLQLGLEKGDKVLIGSKEFLVDDFIFKDSGQILQTAAMAPRIYLSQKALDDTKLIQTGSTKRNIYIFKSPLPEEKIKEIKSKWVKKVNRNGIRFQTATEAGDNIGRVINYLNDFLGLVSLVAIFLSSLGLFYLYSNFLNSKKRDMAIYYCIGLKGKDIFKLYYYHVLFLGLIGVTFSILLCSFIFPLIGSQIQSFFTFSPSSWSSFRGPMLAVLIGLVGTPLLVFPLLNPLRKFHPKTLFEDSAGENPSFRFKNLWSYMPFLLFCYILCVYFSKSLLIGTSFFCGFLIIALIFYPLLIYVLTKFDHLKPKKIYIYLGLKYLTRFKLTSSLIILSLILGSMLVVLIPQLEYGLENELTTPSKNSLPSLFLFDIQPEQVSELNDFFKTENTSALSLSPLIRGRLTKVNGQKYGQKSQQSALETREEERESRFRSRGINLSYRQQFLDSEKIIEGKPFNGPYKEGLAEISIEKRYAKRMGFDIGDVLEFNIFEVPIKGIVTSIRSVRWTSFLPNFFIQFQPGVLDDAPKTYLAAIPSMNDDKIAEIQEKLFNQFPNISVIDISKLITKITGFLSQMALALKFMASISFMAGLLVLFSITQHQIQRRQNDINHLKILGVSLNDLKKMILLEFGLYGFIGSSLGVILSLITSYSFSYVLFDGIWQTNILAVLFPVILITSVCLLLAWFSSKKVLDSRPESVLGEGLS